MKPAILFSVLIGIAHHLYSQDAYYLQTGPSVNTVAKVSKATALNSTVKEWKIYLYKQGASTSGRNFWGSITGKSASQVWRQLLVQQEFELECKYA